MHGFLRGAPSVGLICLKLTILEPPEVTEKNFQKKRRLKYGFRYGPLVRMISTMSIQDLAGLRFGSPQVQIQRKLRRSLIFHFFQNINFIAKPCGKFGTDMFNGNFSRVPRRDHRRGMAHLLTDRGGMDPSKFPPPIAAPSEGMQTGLL
jgi:hypothetical protein